MRALGTPLSMAILGLLREQPRHPYEMQALLRDRHIGAVVKLRGGSLYDAIERLARAGLVEPVATGRAGTRPERTVYALTERGAGELDALVRRYVGTIVPEFPVFAAGLAHILHLPADEAAALLRGRRETLDAETRRTDTMLEDVRAGGLPRTVLLEVEYAQAIRHAESAWLATVIREMADGSLPWHLPET